MGEQLGEGEFEVEDIVKVREANGGYQALIKWKGYEKHESTWEAIVDIRSGYFRWASGNGFRLLLLSLVA